jgi:integrase
MAHFRRHTTKDGRSVLYWRGKVPIKADDGTVTWRDVERSTKSGSHAEARRVARQIEAEYHRRADCDLAPVNEPTFADAALAYMKSGGERRYLGPILELIGKRPLTDINQALVQRVADRLKSGCTPATVNRHIFTPIVAVMTHAAKTKLCPAITLIRPYGHEKQPKLETPPAEWFNEVLPRLSPRLRACLLLITLHGLRIGEAIERTPEDLDPQGWRLSIPDSKTGEPVLVQLSRPVVAAIKTYEWRQGKWLFGTCHRSNIAKAVKKACEAAGVRHYGTHAIGRHSFSVRVLRSGKSVKFLMSAGRWKTAKMPMTRYGHLERSEVDEAVLEMADKWEEGSQPAVIRKLGSG